MHTYSGPFRRLAAALLLILSSQVQADPATPAIRLITTNLPPFTIEEDKTSPGFTIELLQEMFRRMKLGSQTEFYPWSRSQAMTRNLPRSVITPLTRTPERERHYQWLVRLSRQHFCFISARRQAALKSIDAGRSLRIGVLRGSPSRDQLLRLGFMPSHITEMNSLEDMMKELDFGLVDQLFGSAEIHYNLIRKNGFTPADYARGPCPDSGDMWMAAAPGSYSPEEVRQFGRTLEDMQRDGTYAQLQKKYFQE